MRGSDSGGECVRESERASERERESRRLRDEDSSSINVSNSDLMKSREYFNSPLFDFSYNSALKSLNIMFMYTCHVTTRLSD